MTLKKHIPNLLTLCNLLAGTIAIIYAVQDQLLMAVLFVFIGIFFDFFDGLAARLLRIEGDLGKQLDSLADMVTSGVVPGLVLFQLLSEDPVAVRVNQFSFTWSDTDVALLPYAGLLFTLGAAYRLATFNIDDRQTNTFIGLPAPAASLVVMSIPLIEHYGNLYELTQVMTGVSFLVILTVLLTILMNVSLPMFSLKFKEFGWPANKLRYIFLVISLGLLLLVSYYAIPLIILIYVGISLGATLGRSS